MRARVDGIELDYDTFGDPSDPPVLMVMGLGAQRTWWPDALIGGLVGRNLRVVTVDNRDAGLSTKMSSAGPAAQEELILAAGGGEVEPPYTLAEMAGDLVGLLDVLELAGVHVVGASMGGMIAQHLAFSHAERVDSLTSIMSTTGAPDVGQATDEAMEVLLAAPPTEREAAIEHTVEAARVIAGPLFDEEEARRRAAASYDRGFYPEGTGRQLMAILADGNRTSRLARIDVPTLVIHGASDALIDVSGGRATAAAIPDAGLLILEEMGHDLPAPLIDDLVDAIATHVHATDTG